MIRVKHPPPHLAIPAHHISYIPEAPPPPLFGNFGSPYTSFCSQSGEESAAWPEAGCFSGETKLKPAAGGRCLTRNLDSTCPCTSSSCLTGLAPFHQFNWFTLFRAAGGTSLGPAWVTRSSDHSESDLPVRAMARPCLPEDRHLELSHVRHRHGERWLARRQNADGSLLNRVEH